MEARCVVMTFEPELKYHNDLKQEYIDGFAGDVRVVTKSRIITIDKFEQKLGKDMLDWEIVDYEDFFKDLKYTNATSLGAYRATLTNLGRYLCSKMNRDMTIVDKVECDFTVSKLKEFVDKEKSENLLITCYDYENVINNKFKQRLVLLEQIFFMVFWHGLLEVPNDIFNFPMCRFDMKNKTVLRDDGLVVQLNDKEISIVSKLKEEQESVDELTRVRKPTILVGSIEYNDLATDGTLRLLVDPISNNLIHPILGSKYLHYGREESTARENPVVCKFGHGKIKMFTDSIFEKTGIKFRPMSIKRSGDYYCVIKENDLTLKNFKSINKRLLFGNGTKYNSYTFEDMQYILIRMKEQELEAKLNV